MDMSKYEVQGTTFDICPICKNGRVFYYKPKGLIKIGKSDKTMCESCFANFMDGGMVEGEASFKLDLSESDKEHKYANQTLKKSEWERGISDLDVTLQENRLPTYHVVGLPIILQQGEDSHYYTSANMYEERAVRQHYGGSVRVMKGVWIRTGQAESHGELRHIDSGSILLTNKRVIFDGGSKKIEYQLPKIISLTEFEDGFQIGVSNRKKSQIYTINEPHKCVAYIQLAINLYQDSKKKKTKSTRTKEEDEALKMIKMRYAKGELTKEQYEIMVEDLERF